MSALYANIPAELKQLKQWVLWRYEDVGAAKPTKIPYQPNGQKASVTEPNAWSTFDSVCSVADKYSGIGFVFSDNDPYTFIDLDDAEGDNAVLERQLKVFHEFDSYSEVSPSGNGLHIIVKGKVAAGRRRSKIEIYTSQRYATMTGNVYNNKNVINDRQELLSLLWEQMGGSTPTQIVASGKQTQSDEEIIALAYKHNGPVFTDLANGIFSAYPSQSEADQAYLNIIAYYTDSKEQVERIFRASKLMRSKVNTNKQYLPRSINKAFDLKIPPLDFDTLKNQFALAKAGSADVIHTTTKNGHTVETHEIVEKLNAPIPLPPGLMGEIAQFIYAYSTRPVPEVSLAAAIGLMAGICGRAYNVSNTGLNQYVLLLAMTGAGKEAMAEGIDKLMADIRMQVPTSNTFIGPGEISSGSALFKFLGNSSQSFVSILGEFGLKIRQLSAANANGADISLRRMILDLFNKSGHNRVLQASAYSKKEDSTAAVQSPAFSILGESTPERFYEVLNEEMISEGLLPRFLIIEYKGGRVAKNENKGNVAPSFSLIERLASLAAYCDSINHANPRRVINVQQTPDAERLLREWDKLADSKINTVDRDVLRQLWNRADLKVLKLAALVAVGENMIEPTISFETATWAINIVKNDIATLTAKFEAGEIGGNTFEINQYKDMVRVLKEYANKDFAYVSKYQAVQSMHKNKVVNNSYISCRLSKMASFRNDKSGATAALKRTIQVLIDHGKLTVVSNTELVGKYSTTQKAFYIHPSILDE